MLSIYAKIAAVLAIITILTAAYFGIKHKGVVQGKAEVQALWDADKDARKISDNKAIADRLRANELRATQYANEKSQMKKGYENEIAKIRAVAGSAPRLYLPAEICNQRPAGSGETDSASGGSSAPAGTVALPAALASSLFALMQEADEIVAGCRVAQDFIKSQGMAP